MLKLSFDSILHMSYCDIICCTLFLSLLNAAACCTMSIYIIIDEDRIVVSLRSVIYIYIYSPVLSVVKMY